MRARTATALASFLLVVVLGVVGLGWSLSRPVTGAVGVAPAELAAEPVSFTSESGSTIRGWFSRGRQGAGVVLLLPGVREHRRAMLAPATFLRSAGYSVLLIDLQATGESPGDAITFGWRERLDVIAARSALGRLAPGERVGIVGRSLGGAATVLAADRLVVDAVVLEAVYPTIAAAVDNRLRMRFGRAGPWLSPLLLWQLRPRLGVSAEDLRPVGRISRLSCPVLVLAGAEDRHTTAEDTQQLYEAAREPRELWVIPGADHVNYREVAGEAYRGRLLAFFGRTLRR